MKSTRSNKVRAGLERLLLALLVASLCWACVPGGPKTKKADPKLAAEYIAKARTLEQQGELPEALENYKLALTVDPQNAEAGENHARLSQQLKILANERYQLGMKYHRIGKYGLARKEFLTALKFDPDHPEASKMLVSRKPEQTPKYVFHVVKPGESLSLIAKNYYGDYRKYDIIARFNQLEDATRVKPGQRIMIPETEGVFIPAEAGDGEEDTDSYVLHRIEPGQSISRLAQLYYNDYKLFHAIAQYNGMDDATRVTVGQAVRIPKLAGVPFNMPGQQKKQPQPPVEARTSYDYPPMQEPAPDLAGDQARDKEEVDEQILAYRAAGIELFDDGRYDDAIFELNKVIEAAPDDRETKTYLGRAYFEAGKQHFQQEDYDAARESFESARQYDPQCEQCLAFIEKSKLGPLLAHRTKGIDAFGKNDFLSAIFEFEEYLKARPDDQEIRLYLSKAYYQQALTNYNKGDFLIAKKGFESALEYDSKCDKCVSYRDRSLQSHKEAHYNKGIVYFGKEQLAEAIAEWEMVYELDPGYKDVEQNLNKARVLLDKLEKIKRSQQ